MQNIRELVNSLMKQTRLDKNIIEKIKIKWAKKYGIALPLSSEIVAAVNSKELKKLRKHLVTKPTRTISGVSVVAIMAKPDECPGSCMYCPKGKEAPQSYVGYEPAAMRARRNKYNAYLQVQNRLKQLNNVGHPTDKNELIIMGGTFPAMPWSYQKHFIKRAFDAFNSSNSKTLKDAQKKNEKAKHRVVSLVIETRPDYVDIDRLLELGTTRVEIGVQSVYDEILEKVNRKSCVEEAIEATKILKDNCFKVDYHIMLGLPGASKASDIKMFKELFVNPNYRPDGLKIYPTAVIKGTKLYKDWKKGKYKPINDTYIKDVLIKAKTKYISPYTRIKRIMRDIPGNYIDAGSRTTNIRQIVGRELKRKRKHCSCIRCREVGHQLKTNNKIPSKIKLVVRKYNAVGGKDLFISYEDKRSCILLGFIRLSIPSQSIRKEIDKNTALIRELHVFGEQIPLGKKGEAWQHKGFGHQLMKHAEKLAKKKYGCNRIVVLSGAGVKEYYRSLGYKSIGSYLAKSL